MLNPKQERATLNNPWSTSESVTAGSGVVTDERGSWGNTGVGVSLAQNAVRDSSTGEETGSVTATAGPVTATASRDGEPGSIKAILNPNTTPNVRAVAPPHDLGSSSLSSEMSV